MKRPTSLPLSIVAIASAMGLVSGCAMVGKSTYDLSLAQTSRVPNGGDRYCIVEIRDYPATSEKLGQTAPAVGQVMPRLCSWDRSWFSMEPDAVPIIVETKSSNAYVPVSLAPIGIPLGLLHTCSLGAIPGMATNLRMEFDTAVLLSPDRTSTPISYRGTTWNIAGWKPVIESVWTKQEGWIPVPENMQAGFDDDNGQKLDAFCASVARAVQRLTPEEREALRNNDEAWYLDAKQGNKRNRPVSIRRAPESTAPGVSGSGPSATSGRPRIVSQSWSAETRRGSIVLDLSGCEDRNAALAWARDEYLPDYCRVLGVAVSADDPASAPAATIRILGFSTAENGTVRIEFAVE